MATMSRRLLIVLRRSLWLAAILLLIPWADRVGAQEPAHPEELFTEFERNIWPLLTRGEGDSCVSCHDAETKSELRFFPEARASFQSLLEKGYFAASDPDSLLGRVS